MKARTAKPTETADQAFAAHAAIMRAQAGNPALSDNPFWTILRQDAYERFAVEFAKLGN